jgi:hypothetical protein
LTSARVDRIGNEARYSAKGPLTTFSVPPRKARSLTRDVIPVLSCDSEAGINFNLPPTLDHLGLENPPSTTLPPNLDRGGRKLRASSGGAAAWIASPPMKYRLAGR